MLPRKEDVKKSAGQVAVGTARRQVTSGEGG